MAACLAEAGYEVLALDPDASLIQQLSQGQPAVQEPGLPELVATQLETGRLRYATPDDPATAHADVIWIGFDTPVDDDDVADGPWVIEQTVSLLMGAREDALVIISSQLPVGSIFELSERMAAAGRARLRYACIPENLRLGKAIETFRDAERFVVGTRTPADLAEITELLSPFNAEIVAMRIESAEMTKHALNGFLATSVTYINEIATICELVGADAEEVSRGLKSDVRIGSRAYLGPGEAFAGGTLARDIQFLQQIASDRDIDVPLTAGVAASNAAHQKWARGALTRALSIDLTADADALRGRLVAVWGLTYKPGTSTLRRSSALELCDWLDQQGAIVQAHDPAVSTLPSAQHVRLSSSPTAALEDVEALVVCTAWPEYRQVDADSVVAAMRSPVVIDAAGHLRSTIGSDPRIRYVRVGVAA
jgi:UDPglucose 6-dehydrogenase